MGCPGLGCSENGPSSGIVRAARPLEWGAILARSAGGAAQALAVMSQPICLSDPVVDRVNIAWIIAWINGWIQQISFPSAQALGDLLHLQNS